MFKNLLLFCPSDLIDSCRTLFTKWFPFLNWVSSKYSRTALSTSNDFKISHLENSLSCRGTGTNLQILQSERARGAEPRWAERLSRPQVLAVLIKRMHNSCEELSEMSGPPPCVAVFSSSPAPVVMRRQKKDAAPQAVLAIPPELDVSMVLEFVG